MQASRTAHFCNPGQQLHSELRSSIKRALDLERPIITHINADTTWLVQLPRLGHGHNSSAGRRRFNILIDPWLSGGQSDVAYWFSTQWHSIPSSVHTIAELQEMLQEIESLAHTRAAEDLSGQDVVTKDSLIDLVVISHEFTDHCHQATLQEVPRSVPVL